MEGSEAAADAPEAQIPLRSTRLRPHLADFAGQDGFNPEP
jgi:hypothetical protein